MEIEALLQSAEQLPDPTATTVEMIPFDRLDAGPDEPRLARGSETMATRSLRGPRRPRATLRVEEIAPPKKR